MIRALELQEIKKKFTLLCLHLDQSNFSLEICNDLKIEPNLIVNAGRCLIPNSAPYQSFIKCSNDVCGCRISPFIWVSKKLKAIYFEIPKSASSSIRNIFDIQVPNLFFHTNQLIIKHLKQGNPYIYIQIFHQTSVEKYKYLFQIRRAAKKFNRYFDGNTLNAGFSNSLYSKNLFEPFYGTQTEVLEKYADYFSFTFIRSPVERILSNWKMFTTQPNKKYVLEQIFEKKVEEITLNKFISNLPEIYNHHWQTQIDYIPFKKNGTHSLNFIGKLESIDKDWAYLSQRLGINKKLPWLNSTSTSHTQLRISEKKNIECLYKEELDFFYTETSSDIRSKHI